MIADIHNFKRRYERVLARLHDSPISAKNKALMLKFHNFLLSESIGYSKLERYLYDLIKFERLLGKEFEKANEEDIRNVVSKINQDDLRNIQREVFGLLSGVSIALCGVVIKMIRILQKLNGYR